MSARDSRWGAAVALGLTALAGCAGNNAPAGFLASPDESARTAWGGWISLEFASTPEPPEPRPAARVSRLEGELIAVGADSVYVLASGGVTAVSVASVRRATLTAYDSKAGELGTWTLVGTLSTLSHGIGFIISAPLWLATGITATSAQSHKGRVSGTERRSWEDMRPFARFPQGLPPALDHAALRPHPNSPGQKTR